MWNTRSSTYMWKTRSSTCGILFHNIYKSPEDPVNLQFTLIRVNNSRTKESGRKIEIPHYVSFSVCVTW